MTRLRSRHCRASSGASTNRSLTEIDSQTDKSLAGATYGILAALIWACFPAITKLAMVSNALTAWDITAVRFVTAGLMLLPAFWRSRLGALRWPAALLLACCAGAPYMLLTAGGLAFAPGGHMGVITPSCMLLFSTIGSRVILGDQLPLGRIVGVLTILSGIVLLGWDGLTNHANLTWVGDVMFLLGGLSWASYTIGSRVWKVEPFHATVVVAVLSMLLYVPPYALFADTRIASAPWSEIVIQAVFQGVLSAVVALLLYTRAVALLGGPHGARCLRRSCQASHC